MRRIVLVLVLVVIVVIAGYMLFRPKRGAARPSSTSAAADTSVSGTSTPAVRPARGAAARAGRVAGTLKASTPQQRRAQAKALREAQTARRRELRRQAREQKRMLARAGRRGRSTRKGVGLYVLKAVFPAGTSSYAMVDTRKVQVGDIVLGRRIVSIGQDRIEIEAFGRLSTVHVGESLAPSS